MDYDDGRPVLIGDKLKLWDGMNGRVVCKFDTSEFLGGFSTADWSTEKHGVMILSDTGELFHYEEMDEDVELLARSGPSE